MASKQKILIVDDDENIAELISLYLLKECYDTRIVHDGESALQDVYKRQEQRCSDEKIPVEHRITGTVEITELCHTEGMLQKPAYKSMMNRLCR